MTNGLLFTFSANFSRATHLVPQVFSAQIDSPVLNLILAKVARARMNKERGGLMGTNPTQTQGSR